MKKYRLLMLILTMLGTGIFPATGTGATTTVTTAASAESNKVLSDAEALMNKGKAAEAYALLEPFEFERSGEVRFDYLLGIAALDSGQPDKATLALERVLAVDPNFAGARLDMARALFNLGDLPRAKAEFQTVLAQNPPPAAKATVQKYLEAIESREQSKKTRFTAYIEGTLGHDSNVNNSTSQSTIAVPAFGNLVFTLNPSNLKTADNYGGIAAGANVEHQLSDRFGVFAGADLRQRNNSKEKSFDTTSLDISAGVSYSAGTETVRGGIIVNRYNLSGEHNRDTTGFNAVWSHTVDSNTQLNVIAQLNKTSYVTNVMQTNDFNSTLLGLGGLRVLEGGKSALFGSLLFGTEQEINIRADGNKQYYGLRVGAQKAWTENIDIFAQAGIQSGKYDKTNSAFLEKRTDSQSDLSAGMNWRIAQLWTVRPQILSMRNNSNIGIYSFDRIDYSVTVRRDFK